LPDGAKGGSSTSSTSSSGSSTSGSSTSSGGGPVSSHPKCPAGAFFCDDFQTGNLDKWSLTAVSGKVTTATIGDGNVFLLAHVDGAGTALANAPLSLPMTVSTLAVRAMVKVPKPVDDGVKLLELVEAMGNADDVGGFTQSVTVTLNGWTLSTTATGDGGEPTSLAQQTTVKYGVYHCVELDDVLAPTGHVHLFVDGMSVVEGDADTIDFARLTTKGFLRIGAVTTSTSQVDDVEVDDVAVVTSGVATASAQPVIGCSP
jgi:hypothetical protein